MENASDGAGCYDTVVVFGFDGEPDVEWFVQAVEGLLGDDELRGVVKQAEPGDGPQGPYMRMQLATQPLAEWLCMTIADVGRSGQVQEEWDVRQTTWDSTLDEALEGYNGSPVPDGEPLALVVYLFAGQATGTIATLIAAELVRNRY